jgi:hypothetical protein
MRSSRPYAHGVGGVAIKIDGDETKEFGVLI